MKTYCTQNNGNCSTCSLVNYGRDCNNNPSDDMLATSKAEKAEAKAILAKAKRLVTGDDANGYTVSGETDKYCQIADAISHAADLLYPSMHKQL